MAGNQSFKKYIPIIFTAAEEYAAYLLGTQLLFIGRNIKTGYYSYFEARFLEKHFMHLTGIRPRSGTNAERFFELCASHKLKTSDIKALPTGQSALKADVIIPLMKLPFTAKMFGDYNSFGNRLYTEKVSGTTTGCMGFVFDNDDKVLVANTILKEDIRNVTGDLNQIVAIYQKEIKDELYPTSPISCAKPLKGKLLTWPSEISSKITPLPSDK